jgi:hypothetical protein
MPDLKQKPLQLTALILAFGRLCLTQALRLIPVPASTALGEGVRILGDGAGAGVAVFAAICRGRAMRPDCLATSLRPAASDFAFTRPAP